MKQAENPIDKLAMLDERGHRMFIIPAEVKGFFKKRKRMVHSILLLVFLILPWIHIGGHQSVLIDIPGRHFTFFGLSLFSHDAPLLFLVFAILAIGLALVTALWGRLWCGWACPQTVFIETIFRQIEIWIEGNYIERRKLRQEPWNSKKIYKTAAKWGAYIFVASNISHSFVAYFVGSERLFQMSMGSPAENWNYFLLVTIMTAVVVFNFGWFREQLCLIVCPYGRLQSVFLDSHSLTVMYDPLRGEPRKGQVTTDGKQGDCISCNRCVQVCPTGIDIRNGLQFECIACTACVDACDEIMAKVKKPTGLIRYKALTSKPIQWFRARILVYGVLILIAAIALSSLLAAHYPFRLEILRGKGLPFQTIERDQEKYIQNQFEIRIENDSDDDISVITKLGAEELENFSMIIPEAEFKARPHQKRDMPFFVLIKESEYQNWIRKPLKFKILVKGDTDAELTKEVQFVGPKVGGAR